MNIRQGLKPLMLCVWWPRDPVQFSVQINTLRPTKNARHVAKDKFKTFLTNIKVFDPCLLQFIPDLTTSKNICQLVTHMCVSRPLWDEYRIQISDAEASCNLLHKLCNNSMNNVFTCENKRDSTETEVGSSICIEKHPIPFGAAHLSPACLGSWHQNITDDVVRYSSIYF